ncbi:MAG: hypothetical protein HYW24_02870 [Candidatus Aenigmarchaeota archaeon]|nr:hypothetical protein [Candidatus Aenigmarchaeota archaeon]
MNLERVKERLYEIGGIIDSPLSLVPYLLPGVGSTLSSLTEQASRRRFHTSPSHYEAPINSQPSDVVTMALTDGCAVPLMHAMRFLTLQPAYWLISYEIFGNPWLGVVDTLGYIVPYGIEVGTNFVKRVKNKSLVTSVY